MLNTHIFSSFFINIGKYYRDAYKTVIVAIFIQINFTRISHLVERICGSNMIHKKL